jgi:hypothetical protein
MDDFGIGVAALGALRAVLMAMRGTGRTTRLIESLQDGDRVVFTNEREARRVERLAKDRGKDIAWCVVDPKKPNDVYGYPQSRGRLRFDHTWLEQYYEAELHSAAIRIRHIQDNASGRGEPHRQTQDAARMFSRFGI